MPSTGRFMNPDPIGLAGGINLYGYCLNDPVNFIDPTGLYRAAPFGDPIGYNVDYGGPGSWDNSPLPPTKNAVEVVNSIISNPVVITGSGIITMGAGFYTGNGNWIYGGITVTAAGGAMLLADLLGGDTSQIPYDYGLTKGILKNKSPCP